MSTQGQVMKYARGGRRRKGVLDLNVPPPVENQEQAGGPTTTVVEGGQGDVPAITVIDNVQAHQPPASSTTTQPALIDVEELDDDVIISSPRAFQEAKNKSQRNRRTLVVDVESEESATRLSLNHGNKRRRCPANPPVINLEGSSYTSKRVAPPPPPPPPKEPTFSCPVCMGALVEEVTTKCGHIFCKACIKAAISAQPKCPTCRRKVTNKDIIRVYLPTTK